MLTPAQELATMIAIAADAHMHQVDKQGMPYFLHLKTVADYLHTTDLQLMAIAYGHDLLEDTKWKEKDLDNIGFSDRVLRGIVAMTKTNGDYEAYKKQVKENPDAVLVKMCDLRHNLDVRRLKNKVLTAKDVERIIKYKTFYAELEELVKGTQNEIQ